MDELNEAQKKAVEHHGNLLIIAGPGTGKTHTLTHKIAHVLLHDDTVHHNLLYDVPHAEGFDAKQSWNTKRTAPSHSNTFYHTLVALTFTKKAAHEMNQRLLSLISDQVGNSIFDSQTSHLFIGTFHAWCLEILRKFGFLSPNAQSSHTPYKEVLTRPFTLYGEKEKMLLLQEIVSSSFPDWSKKHILEASRLISLCKNQLIPFEKMQDLKVSRDFFHPSECMNVAHLYEKKMFELQAFDFDDILVKTLEFFRSLPQHLSFYRQKLQALFIDEYQDVNTVQYELIKTLFAPHMTICAIGDPDQSIYAFRGSNSDSFLRFSQDFPEVSTFHLEENYRSSSFILKASENLITYNSKRVQRSLRPHFENPAAVSIITASEDWKEAYCVTKEIQKLVGGTDMIESGHADHYKEKEIFRFSDIAVLYRTKAQGRLIEASLKKAGIPCHMIPASTWYLKKEIRTVLAFLRVLLNPRDDVSLLEIFKGRISVFISKIQALRKLMPALTPTECAQKVWDEFSLKDTFSAQSEKCHQNFLLFLSVSTQFDRLKGEDGLIKLLEYFTILQNEESFDESIEAVRLMTIHASKGLEFPVVFITGLEDGLLPYNKESHGHSAGFLDNDAQKMAYDLERLEEERRLLYVGITRAKRKLSLLHALSRDGKKTSASPFLQEIRDELLERRSFKGSKKNLSKKVSASDHAIHPSENQLRLL